MENKKTKTLLWIDDLRNPFLNLENRVPEGDYSIIWVLNYSEFVLWVEKNGLPDLISFDHDLAQEHYTPEFLWNDYQLSKAYQDAKDYKEKTGNDCAKWLVNYCLENNLNLPNYSVHSANPVGADNILNSLKDFYRWKKD